MIKIMELHIRRQPTSIPGCVSEAGGTDPLHVLAMFTNTSGGRPSRPSWSLDMSKKSIRDKKERCQPAHRTSTRRHTSRNLSRQTGVSLTLLAAYRGAGEGPAERREDEARTKRKKPQREEGSLRSARTGGKQCKKKRDGHIQCADEALAMFTLPSCVCVCVGVGGCRC
ncbi:uncharacterized protein [Panulirus ornatus]|uniref:uncharacterized protein isoform X2 n=1 Tax=Panulirus ornatus TaxID=150431 RepID=UPI003A84F9C5